MPRIFTDTAAQEAIDKELATLNSAILVLKARRNSLAAIAYLPDEILSLIFLEVKFLVHDTRFWNRITKVCAHWRVVSFNTPHLWTDVYLNDVNRARDIIQRAKSVPLSVICSLPCSSIELILPQLMSPEHRIRDLDLRLQGTDFNTLTEFLTSDSIHSQGPSLEHIHIQNWQTFHPMARLGNWHELPQLKSLRLEVPLPVKLPFLATLTSLSCTHHNLTVSSVLRALECMPVIEDVCIRTVSNDDGTLPTFPSVTLRALKDFDITLSDPHTSRLFAALVIPMSAYVRVSFTDNDGQELPDIYALSARFCESFIQSSIGAIRVNVSLDFINATISLTSTSTTDCGSRSLHFFHQQELNFQPLFDQLPAEMVTSLVYKADEFAECPDIFPLPCFAHLQYLRLRYIPENQLISVVKRLLRDDDNSMPRFPKLHTLHGDFHSSDHIQVLETLLKERQELGMPIQTITTSEPRYDNPLSHLQEQFGVTVNFAW